MLGVASPLEPPFFEDLGPGLFEDLGPGFFEDLGPGLAADFGAGLVAGMGTVGVTVLVTSSAVIDKMESSSLEIPGPGCSKLTMSLVNKTLKFQTLISQICQYFLMKKCEKLLQCKSFSHFFNKKYHCIWL